MLYVIILLVFGILNIVCPKWIWYWAYGWKHENAKPSLFVFVVYRCIGIAAVILAATIYFEELSL